VISNIINQSQFFSINPQWFSINLTAAQNLNPWVASIVSVLGRTVQIQQLLIAPLARAVDTAVFVGTHSVP